MTAARGGTQSIERSIKLMRALAARARFGWRLSDLARHCDIDKGTARRILTCLVRERLAERSPADQRYLPGPLLFELGLALTDFDEFKMAAYPLLDQLSSQTNAVGFLCLRSGDDLVCAARIGEVPDHAFTLNLGTRRPLAGSSGGAALLITLPAEERQALFERNCLVLTQQATSVHPSLERLLNQSLEMGMGYNEGRLVPGWNSYAIALFQKQEAFASVMICAPAGHFTHARLENSLAVLKRTAQRLQDISETVFGRQRRPEPCPPFITARVTPERLLDNLNERRERRKATSSTPGTHHTVPQ